MLALSMIRESQNRVPCIPPTHDGRPPSPAAGDDGGCCWPVGVHWYSRGLIKFHRTLLPPTHCIIKGLEHSRHDVHNFQSHQYTS